MPTRLKPDESGELVSPWRFVPRAESAEQVSFKGLRRAGSLLAKAALLYGVIVVGSTALDVTFPVSGKKNTPPGTAALAQQAGEVGISSDGIIAKAAAKDCAQKNTLAYQDYLACIAANATPASVQSIEGFAKISEINVKNDLTSNGKWILAGQHLASLQLNATISVFSSDKRNPKYFATYLYWIQNVMQINTANNTLSFSSSVWPSQSYSFVNMGNGTLSTNQFASTVSDGQIRGKGTVTGVQPSYMYDTQPIHLDERNISVYLGMSTSYKSENPVLKFSYALLSGDKVKYEAVYDSVKFINSAINSARYGAQNMVIQGSTISVGNYVIPSDYTSGIQLTSYNTADLVLVGPYDSEIAMFGKTSIPQMGIYGAYYDSPYVTLNALVAPGTGDISTAERAWGIRLNGPVANISSGAGSPECQNCVVAPEPMPALLRKENGPGGI